MKYSIKVNEVRAKEGSNIKGFATVVFGDSFKITNIAILENKDKGELFVSMPRYRSNERDESNGVIYKDVCNPITAEFREELYTNILDAYARIKEPENEETQKQDRTQEMPEFSVTVTPYEREGSNIKGLARIYFENSFIVNNINIVQGKEKIFVSMPSYKTKQVDEQGKPIYQDVCYPVTKDFREKLYNEIISEYEKAKDKSNEKARESAEKHHGNPDKEKDKEATPFRYLVIRVQGRPRLPRLQNGGNRMDMEAGKTLTNEEVIRELLELLKKNAMKEQVNDVFEICSYVDGLEKKIDFMTEELTNMQNQIKEMQEDTLVNNAKKALSEAQERLNARCEQIKSQVLEVKAQVKSTAKSIVNEAKAKGRAALYRVSEFLGIKKRLLDIRENVRGAIKTTDKDIAKTALLAKGFREAGQTVANAFRTFADKPEVDYSQKEQKHPITKAVLAPMKAVKKMLVTMELHLDASIDKLDNLAMNVQLDKEKHMENAKAQEQTEPEMAEAERVEAEIVYSPMVAEPQEYQYNADAFENYLRDNAANDNKNKEIIMQKDKNVR